jgi:hypothetical protein
MRSGVRLVTPSSSASAPPNRGGQRHKRGTPPSRNEGGGRRSARGRPQYMHVRLSSEVMGYASTKLKHISFSVFSPNVTGRKPGLS